MDEILKLATEFRTAINSAKVSDEFSTDFRMYKYPIGCCGDASDLLGQYLLDHGIHCKYVCGTHCTRDSPSNKQSHAWLLLDDGRIVDISGDQFKYNDMYLNYDKPIYVGEMDTFHKLFIEDDCVDTFEKVGIIDSDRLMELYRTILKHIK